MKITGTYTLEAPKDTIWKFLMNPVVLEKITPGIQKLAPKEADVYDAISEIRVGPVKGRFEGEMAVRNKIEEEGCMLVIDQKSKMGNVVAEIGIQLSSDEDAKTVVSYTGEAKMSGMLARTGQRIMSGVVSTLSKQFFKALEEELAGES